MTVAITVFKNLYDTNTNRRIDFDNFNIFGEFLKQMATINFKEKKSAELMSPAVYSFDGKRCNTDVVHWAGWAGLDIDDHDWDGDNLKDELFKRYSDYSFICYSTASSSFMKPKMRIIYPLTQWIDHDNIKSFWWALNTEMGSLADKNTKDLSRMYYLPGNYESANYQFFYKNYGKSINPDELIEKYPIINKEYQKNTLFNRLPENVKDTLRIYKKNQLLNKETKIHWTGYKDCPFVHEKMINDYLSFSETGWYHQLYKIMVSIAITALKREYPISTQEIIALAQEIDRDTGNWYEKRPLDVEAARALSWAYSQIL